MEGRDRSAVNCSKHKASHSKDSNAKASAWSIVSLEKLQPITDVRGAAADVSISHETITEMESTLKDLVRQEEYVRNLRQEVEHKIRLFMLSEASSELVK
jgi:hypothetical protein